MEKKLEVHIIDNGDTFTVWQEGSLLVPKLTMEQAVRVAKLLQGSIVFHERAGQSIDLTEQRATA